MQPFRDKVIWDRKPFNNFIFRNGNNSVAIGRNSETTDLWAIQKQQISDCFAISKLIMVIGFFIDHLQGSFGVPLNLLLGMFQPHP